MQIIVVIHGRELVSSVAYKKNSLCCFSLKSTIVVYSHMEKEQDSSLPALNCQETNPILSSDGCEGDEVPNDDEYMDTDHESVDNQENIKCDLCESIPGLYRLLDLCKDEGTNGLVDKIIISKEHIKKLCNEIVLNSYRSISKIRFEQLNTRRIYLIGCYGRNALIAKLLLKKGFIDQSIYESLLIPHGSSAVNGKRPVPILRPGIYLQKMDDEHSKFMVIHWSEEGCYKDSASSYLKKNMINLHRYLTKITNHQICLMDESDLEDFDWQIFGKDAEVHDEDGSDDSTDDSIVYNFEVKKSQEQKENFELFPGFDLPFSRLVHPDDDHTLNPLIVESVSNQTFLTREMVPATKNIERNHQSFESIGKLQEYFRQKLEIQKCALKFDRFRMTLDKLKIIVKDIMKLPKLFEPYEAELQSLNKIKTENKQKVRNEVQADMKLIERYVQHLLKKAYRYKKNLVHDVFFDEERNFNNLVKKYTLEEENRGLMDYIWKRNETAKDIINSVKEEARKTPDNEFLYQLFELEDESIVAKFLEKYEHWKKFTFVYKERQIIQSIEQEAVKSRDKSNDIEYEREVRNIERKHINEICGQLESIYLTGDLLTILDVERTEHRYNVYKPISFRLFREIEIPRPEQLCLTIFSTQLSQADALEMNKNELFVPQPMINSYDRNPGVSVEIDPETYDFKYVAQFDRKFLLLLWNKTTRKLEIYFDIITRLQKVLKEQITLKKLNPSENFMVAVNEPKGLIAIYDNIRGAFSDSYALHSPRKLNAYSFDEERTNLHLQHRNILLQQWYNNDIPEIAHFFFIKNTEDICFVERNGRARVYNFINDSFKPGIAQIPINTSRIMSTPDGTCFVAFVKERKDVKDSREPNKNSDGDSEITPTEDNPDSSEESSSNDEDEIMETEESDSAAKPDQQQDSNTEVVHGYVFFSEKFSQDASKIIEIPFENPSIELFQFSSFEMRQIHLTTIDQHNGSFQSAIIKITHAKTKYRFERQSVEKTLGRMKIEARDLFTVLGQNTKFSKDVHVGDSLIVGNEKHQVSEIISDSRLRITKPLAKSLNYGKWQDFAIEPKTKVNGLLDAYSMVFTKYAISSPIGRMDDPLTLTVVMELASVNRSGINKYEVKFQRYIEKLFEKFKKDTKKPLGHLKNFRIHCATIESITELENEYTEYQFGDWIIELFCLIPLQIAITRDNEFIPLRDGVYSPEVERSALDDGFGLIGSVTKSISFGWYESIFEYFSSLKVKVISSMGEQSCGLASIERSPQEETFLQLLNAALSNLVIFKSQFAVSRDISSMFQRFQDGTNYFGDDPDIFQARFCIVIKDVAKCDRNDIVEEFHSKFAKIVDKEEEDNFITKLYRNKMTIFPWPVFTESSFYTSIKQFKIKLDEQESQYENARMFVEKIKETLITMRTLELRKLLKDAISFGYEQKDDDPFLDSEVSREDPSSDQTIKCLMGRDDGIPIPDHDVLLSDTFAHVEKSVKLMPDTGLVLLKDKGDFIEISSDLREYFEKHVYPRGSVPDSEWIVHLDNFFKLIINRRTRRLQEWFTKNTSRFPKDHNELPCEENHSIHRCENEVCPIECPIANCRERCESNDHFHALKKDMIHFCGNEHQCPKECEENGICKIVTEPTAIVKEEAEYVSKDPTVCEGPGGGKKEGVLEHINANISPFPLRKKDYISHRVFWERTKFQDPYSKDDREEFKKCDHECADEKHHKIDEFSGKEPTKSYCTQEIFHPTLDHTSKPSTGIGYISTDGHQVNRVVCSMPLHLAHSNIIFESQFSCENPTTNVGDFHIVFVVDRSGSMSSSDCSPHGNNFKTSCIQKSHNNRLGAVYEAIYTFMETRRNSRKATRAGQMSVDRDTTSLILFDYTAVVAFENRNLSNSDELLQIMLGYHPKGDNYYHEGIKKASEVIQTYYDPLR
ncbi:12656_t:CDS:10 [Acaulospora colombiana]|uniref:12656_t:CDS:1 n=1 Tax=Acaulospora colombiana TaxID=27376 RepID=A0ACA9JYS4_9GLOM|nr:12656_t:CDS:10 [Acaulospora colombiana]